MADKKRQQPPFTTKKKQLNQRHSVCRDMGTHINQPPLVHIFLYEELWLHLFSSLLRAPPSVGQDIPPVVLFGRCIRCSIGTEKKQIETTWPSSCRWSAFVGQTHIKHVRKTFARRTINRMFAWRRFLFGCRLLDWPDVERVAAAAAKKREYTLKVHVWIIFIEKRRLDKW